MSREDHVHLEGQVVEIAAGGNFRIEVDGGHQVLAQLAGKMRRNRIRVVLGDRVTVAVSPNSARVMFSAMFNATEAPTPTSEPLPVNSGVARDV